MKGRNRTIRMMIACLFLLPIVLWWGWPQSPRKLIEQRLGVALPESARNVDATLEYANADTTAGTLWLTADIPFEQASVFAAALGGAEVPAGFDFGFQAPKSGKFRWSPPAPEGCRAFSLGSRPGGFLLWKDDRLYGYSIGFPAAVYPVLERNESDRRSSR